MKKLNFILSFLILTLVFSCGQNSAEKKLNGKWYETENEKIIWKFYPDSLVFIDEYNANVEWSATESTIEFVYQTFIWGSSGKSVHTEDKILIEYELSENEDTLFGTLTNPFGKHKFGLIRIK